MYYIVKNTLQRKHKLLMNGKSNMLKNRVIAISVHQCK